MQVPPFLEKNKILVSAILGALIFIALGYWFIYKVVLSDSAMTTITPEDGSKLLPKKLLLISNILEKENIDLTDRSFADTYFIKHSKDFTTYVSTSTSRGRDNPFVPYDFTRSSR